MAERTLTVKILGDSRSLQREFQRSTRSARTFNLEIGKLSRGALAGSGAFRGFARSIAFASSAFLGGAGLSAALRSSVSAASNLQEQITKTDNVFGAAAVNVREFARTSAASLGQAEDQALATVSSFGALLRPLGVLQDDASRVSRDLTTLGADLASFYNTDVQSALDAIRSGLVGESEPLRRYGVLLSETRVQQLAMAESGKTTAKSLTNQEKALARVQIIFRDSALAQGDFAETSGGLANQQRILAAQIRNVQIQLGTALIPTLLDVTRGLTDWLSQSKNQERLQRNITGAVKAAGQVFRAFASVLGAIRAVLGPVVEALGGLKNAIRLVIIALVVAKVAAWTTALVGLGRMAWAARGRVRSLGRSLKGLPKSTPLLIALTITRNFKDDIRARVRERFAPKASAAAITKSDIEDQVAGIRAAFAAEELRDASGAGGRRRGLTAEQRNTFFDNMIARLLDRVQDSDLRGQITKLKRIAGLISERIAATKDITRRLNLEDRLLDVRRAIKAVGGEIADKLKQAAEEAKRRAEEAAEAMLAARNALQFKALGLSATGGERIPGLKGLRRQLGNVEDAVKGTFLDTKKTRSLMSTIRKILAGGMGAVSEDVRSTIRDMLRDLNQQLKDNGPLTAFRKQNANAILSGLGLSPDQVRSLRARLSQVGVGGTAPARGTGAFGVALTSGGAIVVRHTTLLDGRVVEQSVTRHQQKRGRRNPPQKRGSG